MMAGITSFQQLETWQEVHKLVLMILSKHGRVS